MGFSPLEVDRMSPWQFTAAAIGWAKQCETDMSGSEADELWEWLKEKDDVPLSHRRLN